jgi:phospholipid/cholesterol/gamma-HCH transport system permease protein
MRIELNLIRKIPEVISLYLKVYEGSIIRIKLIIKDIQDAALLSWKTLNSIIRGHINWRDTFTQMDKIGVMSLPIVLLTGLFTGLVLALQSAYNLEWFGVKTLTGKLVALSMVRELGPVLTSLMVAGRVSAGITAEIGSMNVSEQLDAMRAMGTDPVRKLVVPRVVAGFFMLPVLTVIGDAMGILGGYFVTITSAGFSTAFYWSSVFEALKYNDLLSGLSKPFFFGIIITVVACHRGFTTTGGTEGVGTSTTLSVVTSSILILFADFLLTKIYLTFF